MNVDQTPYRTIWTADDGWHVRIIDQTRLPHEFVVLDLENIEQMPRRSAMGAGAPLIGASAAHACAGDERLSIRREFSGGD